MFELARVVALLVHEVEQDTRVQVAAARTHHEAARGREAHGSIDGLPVADCGQARAVPQMRDDRTPTGGGPQRLYKVFVGQAMEAVAAEPFVPEGAGQREALR